MGNQTWGAEWHGAQDLPWLPAKNQPANAGNVGSTLVQEYLLEKEMATPSSILAWTIPQTEETGRKEPVHGVAKSWP